MDNRNTKDDLQQWPDPSGKVLTMADSLADLAGTERPAQPTDERAAFEAWLDLDEDQMQMLAGRNESGDYLHATIAIQWEAWQARARAVLAAQPLHEQLREMGEAHVAQPAPVPVPVPPGWKLVPVEPTVEMVGAARISGAEGTDEQIASDLRAAIAVSPEVP